MSEISSDIRSPEENPKAPELSRRTFLKGAGLVATGATSGILIDRLFGVFDSDPPPPNTLSSADYDRIERAALSAKKQATILQTRINETIRTKIPVEISVLRWA